jgi:hypothetical protein
MSKKEEAVRAYNFADASLMQLADEVVSNGTRDSAELTPQGVTAARLGDLAALNDTFRDMEDDEEWAGLVSEKTEDKDAALAVCEAGTRNIRRMVSNVFGEQSAKYRRFGFTGINDLKDMDRIKAYFRVWRRASDLTTDLAPEGLTATVLADFRTACETADDAYDALVDTINDRDIATEERIELGNEIYAEVVKICNTGKTYWFDKEEAKYNDYVITPSGTTVNQPPSQNGLRIAGTVRSQNGNTGIPNALVRAYNVMQGPGAGTIEVFTGADGSYLIAVNDLSEPMTIYMEVSAAGYPSQGRNLNVAPGQTYQGEDFNL